MQQTSETEGTPYIPITIVDDPEANRLAEILTGQFIEVQGVLGWGEHRLIARIVGVYRRLSDSGPESNDIKLTYGLEIEGIGSVNPDNSPKLMLPLNDATRLRFSGYTFSYNTPQELEEAWVVEAQQTISELSINGEHVTTL